MSKFKKFAAKSHLGSTLVLIVISALWLLPTFGLLITSMRESTEAQTTGWWNAIIHFTPDSWTLQAFSKVMSNDGLGSSIISSFAVTLPATILPLLLAAYAA